MSSEEAKATTQNTELVDINCPLPNATLNIACERTKFTVSSLNELNKADKELLIKMTDLDVNLSNANVNSQDIDEALAMLESCPQLKVLKFKMPKIKL